MMLILSLWILTTVADLLTVYFLIILSVSVILFFSVEANERSNLIIPHNCVSDKQHSFKAYLCMFES